jgi:iduronate 2-sulfatase
MYQRPVRSDGSHRAPAFGQVFQIKEEIIVKEALKLLWWCALVLAAACPALAQSKTNHLNVLFIISDDLNNCLGCYGDQAVKTPNIDCLAARGVRFDRAYVQCSLCNPSRVSFLSGLRPDTTGVHDLFTPPRTYLKDYIFMPQYFRYSGYYSAKVGKVYHTGKCEDPISWDLDIREWGKYPKPEEVAVKGEAKGYRASWEWMKLNISDSQMPDGTVARKAVEILEKIRPPEKPFFLGVGFRRPHAPYAAPEKYFDMYPPDKIVLPQEPPDHVKFIPRPALTYNPNKKDMPPEKRREGIAAYYACITFMDAQVGVLLDAMDRNHLWDNTVVVFVGDNGYHLGEHGGMWHKISNFEESARVPLIIVAPGRSPHAVSSRVVELVDLYPTLVQLAGLPTPSRLEGTSLVPLLEAPQRAWDKPAFTQIERIGLMGRSIRTERWRYVEWDGGKQGVQLYDESQDPKEYVNLAEDPKCAETVTKLSKLLHDTTESWPKAPVQTVRPQGTQEKVPFVP